MAAASTAGLIDYREEALDENCGLILKPSTGNVRGNRINHPSAAPNQAACVLNQANSHQSCPHSILQTLLMQP